jgi:hypothetical protein
MSFEAIWWRNMVVLAFMFFPLVLVLHPKKIMKLRKNYNHPRSLDIF